MFLNQGAAIETTLQGFEPGVTYRLHLAAAGRNDGGGAAKLQLSLDGKPLHFDNSATLNPPICKYQTFTSREQQLTAELRPLPGQNYFLKFRNVTHSARLCQ